MVQKDENLFVVLSVDDTKISERLRYDPQSNNVMGLQLPLNKDGVPIRGAFQFTTLADVQQFLSTSSMASYAKLMTITSLGPNSTTYHLVIYGTKGSDTSPDVNASCEFVQREFAKIGVTVLCKALQFIKLFANYSIYFIGFSSDGASSYLKNMQLVSNIPLPANAEKDCPEEFASFFFGSWNPRIICVQDAKHKVQVLANR